MLLHSYCPYCVRVKGLFQTLNVPFNAVELDQIPDGDAIQAELAKISGQRTVPNVYIKGQVRGGALAASRFRCARAALVSLLPPRARALARYRVRRQHIGGCDRTVELHSRGQLLPLVQ